MPPVSFISKSENDNICRLIIRTVNQQATINRELQVQYSTTIINSCKTDANQSIYQHCYFVLFLISFLYGFVSIFRPWPANLRSISKVTTA